MEMGCDRPTLLVSALVKGDGEWSDCEDDGVRGVGVVEAEVEWAVSGERPDILEVEFARSRSMEPTVETELNLLDVVEPILSYDDVEGCSPRSHISIVCMCVWVC